MATVKYYDLTFECATAIKGDTYVHLLDSNGTMIVAFDGVTDFSVFSIEGGEWCNPTAEHDCYVAVIRDDGTIGKGGHRCCDLIAAEVCEQAPTTLVEGRWYLIKAEG